MQSKATIAYAQAIESAMSRIESAKKALTTLKANRKSVGKMLRRLERIEVNDFFVSTNVCDEKPTLFINMHDLESFKDPKLVAVLEYFDSLTTYTDSKDWADYLNRDYRFFTDAVDVKISAYVKSDSPTCRKVLIGTKVQTVEKYEIVCD